MEVHHQYTYKDVDNNLLIFKRSHFNGNTPGATQGQFPAETVSRRGERQIVASTTKELHSHGCRTPYNPGNSDGEHVGDVDIATGTDE